MIEEILNVHGLNKCFYGNQVLKNIHFNLYRGEVLGLIGANAAGKSTLARILAGELQMDSGRVVLNGKEVVIHSIDQSKKSGIWYISATDRLASNLTVGEALIFMHPYNRPRFLTARKVTSMAREILAENNLEINPELSVGDITLGEQKQLEMALAVSQNARIIILDEINEVTNPECWEWFQKKINDLRKIGYSFLVISHNLNDLIENCTRIAVLQEAQIVQIVDGKDASRSYLYQFMRNNEGRTEKHGQLENKGRELLRLEKVKTSDGKEISCSLQAGEVLGIYTTDIRFADELTDLLCGLRKSRGGKIILCGKPVTMYSPDYAARLGIVRISGKYPDDALFYEESIYDNLTFFSLKRTESHGFRNKKLEKIAALECAAEYGISEEDSKMPVWQVSDGYKQKLIFAQSFLRKATIYVMNNSMAHLDYDTQILLYEIINDLKKQGKAFLLITHNFEVAQTIADRLLYVMEGGVSEAWFQ